MANVSNEQRDERRQEVARLWARGLNIGQIARALRSDWQTIRADVDAIAAAAADELDVADEYRRLLAGAREAEAQSWILYSDLQKLEGPMAGPLRLGGLSRVLAAQQQVLAVLAGLTAAGAHHRPSDTDRLLAQISGAGLPAAARRRLTVGES